MATVKENSSPTSYQTDKLGYASSSNISFNGKWDTGIEREEWDEMSDHEKAAVENECIWELVDIWVEED
jgi:hypothetical protein